MAFSFVVRVPKSCCPLHVNDLKSCIDSDAFDKVHGGDDGTVLEVVGVKQSLHVRTVAWAPWPNGVCRVFAFGYAFEVNRMFGKNFLTFENESIERISSGLRVRRGSLDKFVSPCLSWHIVRRCACKVFDTVFHDEQVAVGKTRVEFDIRIAQFMVERLDEFVCLFGGNVACAVVLNLVSIKANEITSHCQFTGANRDSHACCFQTSSSFKDLWQIVAKERKVCDLAAGVVALWHGVE